MHKAGKMYTTRSTFLSPTTGTGSGRLFDSIVQPAASGEIELSLQNSGEQAQVGCGWSFLPRLPFGDATGVDFMAAQERQALGELGLREAPRQAGVGETLR